MDATICITYMKKILETLISIMIIVVSISIWIVAVYLMIR